MDVVRKKDIKGWDNPGMRTNMLMPTETVKTDRLSIMRQKYEVGARNQPHRHPTSEQFWVVLVGSGEFELEGGKTVHIEAGDVVRVAENELHGFLNTGDVPFEYVSITCPPNNFDPEVLAARYKNAKP